MWSHFILALSLLATFIQCWRSDIREVETDWVKFASYQESVEIEVIQVCDNKKSKENITFKVIFPNCRDYGRPERK